MKFQSSQYFPLLRNISNQYEHPFSNPSYMPEWTSQELNRRVKTEVGSDVMFFNYP